MWKRHLVDTMTTTPHDDFIKKGNYLAREETWLIVQCRRVIRMFPYCPSKPALTEPNGKVHFPRLAIKTDKQSLQAQQPPFQRSKEPPVYITVKIL